MGQAFEVPTSIFYQATYTKGGQRDTRDSVHSLTGPKPVVAPAEVTEPDTRYSHLEEVKTALDSEVAGKQPVQKTTPDAVKEEGEVLTGEVPNDSAGTSTKSRMKSNEYSNSPLKD